MITVKTKLLSLMVITLVMVLAAMLVLRSSLFSARNNFEKQVHEYTNITIVSDATIEFNRMVYWLTEMTHSLSEESKQFANQQQTRFTTVLNKMNRFAPEDVSYIKKNLPTLIQNYVTAMQLFKKQAYLEGQDLMRQTRITTNEIDRILNNASRSLIKKSNNTATNTMAMHSNYLNNSNIIIAVIAGIIVASLVMIRSSIIHPLQVITNATAKLAEGDFNLIVPYKGRHDEIGSIATSLEQIRNNGLNNVNTDQQHQENRQIAKHDLNDAMDLLANRLEQKIQAIVHDVAMIADKMALDIEKVGERTHNAKDSTHHAIMDSKDTNSTVESLASTTQKMSKSIQTIST